MTPLFDYTYIDHQAPQTLVLFHGTGGDKSDFLFLDNLLEHSFNLLALQGNIREEGMSRFFKRFAMGVFDQENMKSEVENLHKFIVSWQQTHHEQQPKDFVYFGYSNGANMILAFLFYFPEMVTTAVLLHPMLPFVPTTLLNGKQILITHGQHDQMIAKDEQRKVTKALQDLGAVVVQKEYEYGHQITKSELYDVIAFLRLQRANQSQK